MKSSTLFKIGFIGMGISVVGALSPVVLAVLGEPEVSMDLGEILNEKTLGLVMIFFTGVILRGIMKKKDESMLASIKKQTNGQP